MAVGLASAMLRTLLRQCVYRCAARQAGSRRGKDSSIGAVAEGCHGVCLLLPASA